MPVPPGFHTGHAGFHYLQRIDYDGRPCGLEIYQWQPTAKLWCRPNEYARGRDLELIGYRYVATCPTPPFAEELESAERMLKYLKGKISAKNTPQTRLDFDVFQRLVREHLFVLPKK
jgi:hypothetical protein